jgi:hypothetical protein
VQRLHSTDKADSLDATAFQHEIGHSVVPIHLDLPSSQHPWCLHKTEDDGLAFDTRGAAVAALTDPPARR